MRAALVLLSLSSVAAFGGGKVIAGCLDPTASNYNAETTLEVSAMCLYHPAPPNPPMTPGRYGRVSALSGSNRFQPPARRLPLTPPLACIIDAQGKGECCTNGYNCRGGQCTSSVGDGKFDTRCLGAGIWAILVALATRAL